MMNSTQRECQLLARIARHHVKLDEQIAYYDSVLAKYTDILGSTEPEAPQELPAVLTASIQTPDARRPSRHVCAAARRKKKAEPKPAPKILKHPTTTLRRDGLTVTLPETLPTGTTMHQEIPITFSTDETMLTYGRETREQKKINRKSGRSENLRAGQSREDLSDSIAYALAIRDANEAAMDCGFKKPHPWPVVWTAEMGMRFTPRSSALRDLSEKLRSLAMVCLYQ